ncbi:spore coat protein [Clostridium lundense]|uniref:spore coat protein n=1 Tax=Clostridium lundense TaxID=319475 RepID=UPI00047F22A3|nr:spore coat protein [Clostridium lundense]
MGLFDMDDNTINSMDDKDIALDTLAASKTDISLLSKAIPETTNPQLRQMLTAQLNSCIADHFKLSDMAIHKGWYPAYSSPQDQLRNDLKSAEDLNI